MMQPSNTPPDGDFVRYVERLTAGKPAPGAQENFLDAKKAVPAAAPLAAFFRELGEMARRAAEEVRKLQQTHSNNKP